MSAMNQALSAFQQTSLRVEDSPTSTLSSTVVIADPNAHWVQVQKDLLRELANFGEIARLDCSMAPVLRMLNITFFDVRSANDAVTYLAGRAEQLPPTGDDFRIVLVSLAAFEEKMGLACNFGQFGEVAALSMYGNSAIVEYYDIRGAMLLVAAGGGSASPCTPQRLAQHSQMQNAAATAAATIPPPMSAPAVAPPPGLEMGDVPRRASEPNLPVIADEPWHLPTAMRPEQRRRSESNLSSIMKKSETSESPSAATISTADSTPKAVNRPVRTKVSSRDFSKYDLDPEKIARGEDARTTVMVRNLVGPRARKDFLRLLEKSGLADNYTFFYMPCKEHRDVPAGFAFLNLNTPADVLKLHSVVKRDVWRHQIRDSQAKALGLSYARFQGHEELMEHFSSSVVLCEQDPEKRPLFCNPAKKADGEVSPSQGKKKELKEQGEEKHSSEGEDSQANQPWVGA